MERDEILNGIEEQERWAAGALSHVQESSLFRASSLSDAEFLVLVRDRIEKSRDTVVYVPRFMPFRRVAWVASACMMLLVAVIAGGRFSYRSAGFAPALMAGSVPSTETMRITTAVPLAESAKVADMDIVTMQTGTIVDSLAAADIDPVELAQYLDVPEYVEEEVADTLEEGPLTDQLLALDAGTLEEVLNDLEDTEFF